MIRRGVYDGPGVISAGWQRPTWPERTATVACARLAGPSFALGTRATLAGTQLMGKRGARASIPTVQQLLDLEKRIAAQAAALSQIAVGSQPALAGIADELNARARKHQRALGAAQDRVDAVAPPLAELRSVRALLPLYVSLNEAVLAYAALHALAHRAFDSQGDGSTADLAESQLRAYAAAIQELDVIASDAVVLESSETGTDCRCECPACGLGLCLCSPHGANTIRQAWRETLPPPADGGLRVRPPRLGSEAQRVQLHADDHLVAIDGTAIANDLDASTVQVAIRAHGSGEELRLTIRRAEGDTREVTVRRPQAPPRS